MRGLPTILFTYEFGAGLGHLNRLIAVAKRLAECNRLVFAIPEPRRYEPIIRQALGPTVEIRQGAFWPAPKDPAARQATTLTFADVACLFGFHIVQKLHEAVLGASDLVGEVAPRLIVADFAPTMRIASLGKVPTVVAGNGYTVPPPGQLLPLMRPWGSGMHPKSRAHEALLLAATNEVSARNSGPAIDFFADLFHGEASFVSTLTEFDPYRHARATPPLWPFNIPKMPMAHEFVQRRGPAIFCYLQYGHPALLSLLRVLSDAPGRAEIYVEGIDPERLARRCSAAVVIHRAPVDFSQVLPETSLLVHHAGLGTAYAGLAAGVPQLVLPINLEHLITTRGLEQFDSAVPLGVSPPPEAAQLQRLLEHLLTDWRRQQSALAAARELESRRDDTSLDRIIDACAAFL